MKTCSNQNPETLAFNVFYTRQEKNLKNEQQGESKLLEHLKEVKPKIALAK